MSANLLIAFLFERQRRRNQIYRRLITKFGIKHQLNKVAEEASELSKAALKLQNATTPEEFIQRREELAAEIADTQLTTEQVIDHFRIERRVQYYREKKLREKIQPLLEATY